MEESEVKYNKRLSSSSFSSHPHFQLKSNVKPQLISMNFERAARITNKNETACWVSVKTVTKHHRKIPEKLWPHHTIWYQNTRGDQDTSFYTFSFTFMSVVVAVWCGHETDGQVSDHQAFDTFRINHRSFAFFPKREKFLFRIKPKVLLWNNQQNSFSNCRKQRKPLQNVCWEYIF